MDDGFLTVNITYILLVVVANINLINNKEIVATTKTCYQEGYTPLPYVGIFCIPSSILNSQHNK